MTLHILLWHSLINYNFLHHLVQVVVPCLEGHTVKYTHSENENNTPVVCIVHGRTHTVQWSVEKLMNVVGVTD